MSISVADWSSTVVPITITVLLSVLMDPNCFPGLSKRIPPPSHNITCENHRRSGTSAEHKLDLKAVKIVKRICCSSEAHVSCENLTHKCWQLFGNERTLFKKVSEFGRNSNRKAG